MGLSGVGPGSILIILLIIILLFGSKRIANVAKDLAKGIKSFRSGLEDKDEKPNSSAEQDEHRGDDKPNEPKA